MEIKVVDCQGTPMIDGEICYLDKIITVEDAKQDIEHYTKQGAKILIKQDNGFVSVDKYYNTEKNNDEIEEKEDGFEWIFNEHWKKRVNLIQEFTDDIDKVEEILEFAIENDESDKVVEGIKEYLADLR